MAIIPTDLLLSCTELTTQYHERDWKGLGEAALWDDLVLRILSTQTRWEHAVMARDRLKELGTLDALRSGDITEIVLRAQMKSLRPGVRWFNRKANQIWRASRTIYHADHDGIAGLLRRSSGPTDARSNLTRLVPGIGMKQASHFLQAIGFGNDFAILDRHLVEFLGRRPGPTRDGKSYERCETEFRALATTMSIHPAVLDYAIWNHMRR